MFLNCEINFRSVPPLTSACCSCAFAVRCAISQLLSCHASIDYMHCSICGQRATIFPIIFLVNSGFCHRRWGFYQYFPCRNASAPPLAWLPRFVDLAECRGRAAVGDSRRERIELRGQEIRMISDKGSGWCPAPRLSCYRNRYSSAVNYCGRHRAGSRGLRPRRGGEKPLQCKAD